MAEDGAISSPSFVSLKTVIGNMFALWDTPDIPIPLPARAEMMPATWVP